MNTSIRKPPTIIEKITCDTCHRFVGLVTSDGAGPQPDECLASKEAHRVKCTIQQRVSKYDTRKRPSGNCGGHSGPLDSDAGGYQSIAIRAMEDGGQ